MSFSLTCDLACSLHSLTYMCRAGAIRTDDNCVVLKVRRLSLSLSLPLRCCGCDQLCVKLCPPVGLQTLPCLVRMCSKEHLLEERVEGAETLAYLMEPDVELQRIASTTDHLVAMLADYFKYPSSVSAIADIKRVSRWASAGPVYPHPECRGVKADQQSGP